MAKILYARTEEDWRRGQKYAFLDEKQHVGNVEWQELQPDAKHNWLTEGMRAEFVLFLPLGGKETKGKGGTETIFQTFSNGVKTNRDRWVYNFSRDELRANIKRMIETYNEQVLKWRLLPNKPISADDFVLYDEKKISWSGDLKEHLSRGVTVEFDEKKLRRSKYRPFTESFLYFDAHLNNRRYLLPYILPTIESEKENQLIWIKVGSDWPMFSLTVNLLPDLLPQGGSQCFPFYTYSEDGSNRRENVTDWALEKFRGQYGDTSISKWDIFHYVYAVLHHPAYRERYAANLKRELPRVPFAPDFRPFAEAGARLAELHVNYERQPEHPLERVEAPGAPLNWRVERMKLSKDRRALVYNDFLTLSGIPPEVFDYRLGNRSALEWVVDQYRVTTDPRSRITNDPNRPDDPHYILRLVGQVVTVSLETVALVRALPALGLPA
jgi:predicted helicase